MLLLVAVAAACSAPEPEVVEVTVEVEKEVQVEVTVEVEKEVEVVKEVEVTVEVEKEVEVIKEVEVMAEAEMAFEGVEVNILTIAGDQISGPMRDRAPAFEALTGAKVNIADAPFNDLYSKILVDAADPNGEFDAYVFAVTWTPDFAAPGFLEDLGPRVAADEALEWNDVTGFFRDYSSRYEGTLVTMPLDGDFHQVYYRSDVLDAAGFAPTNNMGRVP